MCDELYWRPIETAPMDGTEILGWCGDYVDICYMVDHYSYGEVWRTAKCEDFGGYETPTHWMPLPDPPK
jgi:hypothetical protein